MEITKNTVVQFHYTLKDDQGMLLESSKNGDPMAFLCGHNNIIKGLEAAMEGKQQGDSFSVTVEPKDAYGDRKEGQTQRIPVKHMMGQKRWKKGMAGWVKTDKGDRQFTVIKLGKFMADVDFNHPLAGKVLTFDVDIVDVREATEEEIAHRHAHGVGGHHHH
ncbi:MAG: peptidylprolyl isomerase [Gammaproteobacteria bacterium]|nr:MAG: peptidylprolyl isomerase [Gammaproteobacteria bacterium]